MAVMLPSWRIADSIRQRELPPLVIPMRSAHSREHESSPTESAWAGPSDAVPAPVPATVIAGDTVAGQAGIPLRDRQREIMGYNVAPPASDVPIAASNGGVAPAVEPGRRSNASEVRQSSPLITPDPEPALAGRATFEVPAPRPSDFERFVPIVVDDDGAGLPGVQETVRFRRMSDEPVQLLPGRLEVLEGEKRFREIRFVRVPGQRAELTLGREGGASPLQVALESRTVSRRHALFAFIDGQWGVTNLSQTNPLVVNDKAMSSGDAPRPLVDGDRIELGDVVLRFRAQ